MPFGDRTGPEGRGPRTGRGLGDCDEVDYPKDSIPTPRGDFGFGRGFGRGFRQRRRFM